MFQKTLVFLALASAAFAQVTTPAPQPVPTVSESFLVTSSPKSVATYQTGQVATVQFRVQLGNGLTKSDFRGLPIVFGTTGFQGADMTAATTKCQVETGICTVRSDKPQTLLLTAWQNGVFGLQQVALNFTNLRSNFPASIDITSSMAQAQEGASTTLIATSSVSVDGPVTVQAEAIYTNDTAMKTVYLPDGVKYGQRIEINTDTLYPLSFRDRRNFRVRFFGPNSNLLAEGFGSSVGLTEWNGVNAQVDDNGDFVVTLDAPYSASVDYTVVLLRGDQFRVELSQSRSEIFVYPQGSKTKVIFNRGSLGENGYYLPNGFYSLNVNAFDRSNGIRWNQSRADALGLNGQFQLR